LSVELRSVRKTLGKFTLNIEALAFEAGSYNVVLGPSGSGKTTMLRLIAGLEFPDEGRIFIDGEDVTKKPAWRRSIGLVFQSYALYPHMTAFDNIATPLRVRGVSKKEIRERVVEVAQILGIYSELEKYPSQLSGGQQQRVALARALVKQPKVLLLDEPLSNLDARLRLDVRDFLKELQRRLRMTVVHVTHDQEEAMAIADRIAVLNNGLLIQVGRPEEIYSSPSSLFLFKFIGLSNTIPGSLLGLEREEIVGFRPEDARLSKSSGKGCITVKILRIQFAGSHRIVVASIKDQWEEVKIFVRTEPDSEFEEGSQACLEIEREKVIIFKDGKMVKKGL